MTVAEDLVQVYTLTFESGAEVKFAYTRVSDDLVRLRGLRFDGDFLLVDAPAESEKGMIDRVTALVRDRGLIP